VRERNGRGSLQIVQEPYRGYTALCLLLNRGDGTVEMIAAKIQFR